MKKCNKYNNIFEKLYTHWTIGYRPTALSWSGEKFKLCLVEDYFNNKKDLRNIVVWALMKPGPDRCPAPKGRPFQTHSLQIILFGPFTYEPNVILGSLKIVSLQELKVVSCQNALHITPIVSTHKHGQCVQSSCGSLIWSELKLL